MQSYSWDIETQRFLLQSESQACTCPTYCWLHAEYYKRSPLMKWLTKDVAQKICQQNSGWKWPQEDRSLSLENVRNSTSLLFGTHSKDSPAKDILRMGFLGGNEQNVTCSSHIHHIWLTPRLFPGARWLSVEVANSSLSNITHSHFCGLRRAQNDGHASPRTAQCGKERRVNWKFRWDYTC